MEPTTVVLSSEQLTVIVNAIGAAVEVGSVVAGLLVALIVGVTWKG